MRFSLSVPLAISISVGGCTARAPERKSASSRPDSGSRGQVPDDEGTSDEVQPEASAKSRLRVLFIGNSLTATNDLPGVLAKLGEAPESQVSFSVGQHTVGGARWEEHDADPAVEPILQQGWDVVVLQDQSVMPWYWASGIKPALISLDTKARAAGAKTVLFMTWASGPPVLPQYRFEQSMAVNNYYERHAAAVGATVAPVGRAWERALRDPAMTLHSDDIHPNPRGTYLSACVFYGSLTQSSPVGLASNGGLDISSDERTRLQDLAWETILAHRRASSSAVGVWPLSADPAGGGQDFAPGPDLTLGDLVVDGGSGAGTRFDVGRYAAIPYFPGLNVPRLTVVLEAYRSNWSIATSTPEVLVSKPGAYELRDDGQNLEARVHTDEDPPALTYASAGLSPGWHQLALTYDGAIYAMWIDAKLVASSSTHGDLRYFSSATNDARFSAVAIGADTVDTATTGTPPSSAFRGGMALIRLVDRALTEAELVLLR